LEEANIKIKINSLLREIQYKTGVSDEEMMELKKIIEVADLSQEKE
tara:strand:+ start:493 stop:630 length:138 start_codon:yes stop_codon:yes gene_type:complete